MLNYEEAQELVDELIDLRVIAKETKNQNDIKAFRNHEKKCIDKFSYIVFMKTARYRNFPNYEDLNQEGFEALVKGLKNYNPKKGNIFWWLHRYTATRISRAANLHTTIRYPMKVAKETIPHREYSMPTIIADKQYSPDYGTESEQLFNILSLSFEKLSSKQQKFISLVYGLEDKAQPISKICRRFSLTRVECYKLINEALDIMRENFILLDPDKQDTTQ